ncbi:MAG: hypothetical protein IPK33_11570 [Gemmatimonadetes bacterium]|nr:hypothetical protein [Gemmatimonadota bacterium]
MKPTAGARGRALRGWWFALAAVAIGCRAAPVPHIAPDDALLARLGHPPTARLLILHADDMAMTSGVTHVTQSAVRAGIVNSASMLAPRRSSIPSPRSFVPASDSTSACT